MGETDESGQPKQPEKKVEGGIEAGGIRVQLVTREEAAKMIREGVDGYRIVKTQDLVFWVRVIMKRTEQK